MNKDQELIKLAKLNEITIEDNIYALVKPLNGKGGSSFQYEDLNNNKIFVKFLIAPRNEIEINKFKWEIKLLEYSSTSTKATGINITPEILYSTEHETLPIFYYVTKWVEGMPLNQKLSSLMKPTLDEILVDQKLSLLMNPTLDEILDIVHRCSSATSYITPLISHRDFHPGNIIFLNETPEWDPPERNKNVDPKVVIADFGNAIMPLAFNYEDKELDLALLYKNINHRIEGSFRSLPPEVFNNPINAFQHNPGCGESWAIGILFYKLLAKEDILNINSITKYSQLINENKLENIIARKIDGIKAKLNNNLILVSVLKGLLQVNASLRMSPGLAAGLLWDYRFGDLCKESVAFQLKYIEHGRNYPIRRPDEYECY